MMGMMGMMGRKTPYYRKLQLSCFFSYSTVFPKSKKHMVYAQICPIIPVMGKKHKNRPDAAPLSLRNCAGCKKKGVGTDFLSCPDVLHCIVMDGSESMASKVADFENLLAEQCLRYEKIRKLPAAEREKYAAGIAKLEQQIGQLRDACGMNIDSFCLVSAQAFVDVGAIAWSDEMAEHIGALLDEAGKCYNIGDKAGMLGCFMKIKLYIGGRKDARGSVAAGEEYRQPGDPGN